MSASLQELIQTDQLWLAKAPGNLSARAQAYTLNKESISTPFGMSGIDSSFAEGGLLHGAAHEFIVQQTGTQPGLSAKLLTARLIVNHIDTLLKTSPLKEFSKLIVWISQQELPSPYVLLNGLTHIENERDIKNPLLPQCIFITPESDAEALKVIDILLGSPAVSMLIAELPTIAFAEERRFAVRTKKHDILSVFLREEKALRRSSAFHSRWSISPAPTVLESPVFTLRLKNKKGMQPAISSWQIAFDDAGDVFRFKDSNAHPAELSITDSTRLAG